MLIHSKIIENLVMKNIGLEQQMTAMKDEQRQEITAIKEDHQKIPLIRMQEFHDMIKLHIVAIVNSSNGIEPTWRPEKRHYNFELHS